MENNYINMSHFIEIIHRRGKLIIGLILVSMLSAYIISVAFIEAQYQTEMWIRINRNFLYGENEISVNYLKSNFFYPEVIALIGEDYSNVSNIKNRLILSEINGLIHVVYLHQKNQNGKELLERWLHSVRVKLILDEMAGLRQSLNDDYVATTKSIEEKKKRLDEIERLLSKETPYTEMAKNENDRSYEKTYIISEINPSYSDLIIHQNNTKLIIVELESELKFMESLLEEYNSVAKELKNELVFISSDQTAMYARLSNFRSNYNTYLFQKNKRSGLSVQPFQVISEPFSNSNPINKNILVTVFLGGFMGFTLAMLIVFIEVYSKTISVSKD